jgi:hypothetical protein
VTDGKLPAPDRFWLWWPIAGIAVLTANSLWFVSPLGLGFGQWPTGVKGQIADGIFRFSYFVVNPSLFIAWAALPWFQGRQAAGVGWRMLGFIAFLFAGCIAAVFALV